MKLFALCMLAAGMAGKLPTTAVMWVLTLPAAMALAGGLYFLLRQFV